MVQKPANKFNITSGVAQAVRKRGVVDKTLALSKNDSWEASHGNRVDLMSKLESY